MVSKWVQSKNKKWQENRLSPINQQFCLILGVEERTSSLLNALAPCRALKHRQKFCQYCPGTFSPPTPFCFMFEFTRDCASDGPKAIVWTENEKIVYPNLHVDKKWWILSSNIFHTLDQALHISAANPDGE